MNKISYYIEFLLYSNDCVVVPGLGAFFTQRVKAVLPSDGGAMLPPSVSIAFNAEVRHEDALLASTISRCEKISYESAARLIISEVDYIKNILKREGRFDFDAIGCLTDQGGRYEFTPSACCSLSTALLSPIDLVKLDDFEHKNNVVTFNDNRINTRRIVNYVAAIAVLICCLFTLSTPITTDDANLDYASLNLLKAQKELISQIENKSGELKISLPPEDSKSIVSEHQELVNDEIINDYILVVASLQNMDEAQRFISSHKNYKLKTQQSVKKIRVYVASDNDKNSLQHIKNSESISADFPDAWVCRTE